MAVVVAVLQYAPNLCLVTTGCAQEPNDRIFDIGKHADLVDTCFESILETRQLVNEGVTNFVALCAHIPSWPGRNPIPLNVKTLIKRSLYGWSSPLAELVVRLPFRDSLYYGGPGPA